MVKNFNSGTGNSNLVEFTVFGQLFLEQMMESMEKLWKSDGTEAGTVMIKDINKGSDSST